MPLSALVDTGQAACYDDTAAISAPARGEAYYGQASGYSGDTTGLAPFIDAQWASSTLYVSTTHVKYNGFADNAAYVCFGRTLGFWSGAWQDVHGAGCQRSDLKSDTLSRMMDYIYEPDENRTNLRAKTKGRGER